VSDRGWILATMLDLQATDGEVDAAAQGATPGELAAALSELDLAAWWHSQRINDLRGQLAHLREQHPELAD